MSLLTSQACRGRQLLGQPHSRWDSLTLHRANLTCPDLRGAHVSNCKWNTAVIAAGPVRSQCRDQCISSGLCTGPSIAHQPSEPSRVFGLRCFCTEAWYSWVAASTKMKCPDAISTVPNIALTDFPNRKAKVSAEMMSAASKVGFFYVTGKRITSALPPLSPLVEEMCVRCRAWACTS